jgi:ubiquinone/menaquinone biosynthesis C-methylase UbiE
MTSKPYFEQVAGQWDRMRTAFFSTAVRDAALKVIQPQPGQTAADIGAGTGFLTEALLAAGLRVVAVDQSPGMIGEMRAKFGEEQVDYREGEAEKLPLAAAEVDHALANMFLHHVENPARAIAEMARIIKPGGHLVITDLDEHRHEFLLKEHHDRWPGFRREDVLSWLKAAGLLDSAVDCVGADCCSTSQCGADEARISIFIAHGRKG